MSDKIDLIMNNYNDKLKVIDEKYKKGKPSKEVKDVNADKKEQLRSDIRFTEISINNIIDILNNEELTTFEKNEYNKILQEKQDKLKILNESKEELDKIYEEAKMAKQKELLEFENRKMILKSGREVTVEESKKIDQDTIRDMTIKELNLESKNISLEIQKTKLKLDAKSIEMQEFKYEYEEKDGVKIPLNGTEFKKIYDEFVEIQHNLSELNDMQKKCNKFIEELKEEITKETQRVNKVLHDKYGEPIKKEEPSHDEEQSLETQNPEQPNTEAQSLEIQNPEQLNTDVPSPETQSPEETNTWVSSSEMIEPEEQNILEPSSEVSNIDEPIQEVENPNTQIIIGKNSAIKIGNTKYVIDDKTVKEGLNLSEDEIEGLLNEYVTKENEKELVKALIEKKEFDPVILNIVDKTNSLLSTDKKEIIQQYLNKTLTPNDEKDIGIEYDADSLSKVSILKRIFKKELNNKEKYEIITRAKVAKIKGIATVKGEYKLSRKEKFISMFTRNKPLSLPTTAQIDAAIEYNENLYGKTGKEFKEALKISEYMMETKEAKRELKSLAKSQQKQDKQSEYYDDVER